MSRKERIAKKKKAKIKKFIKFILPLVINAIASGVIKYIFNKIFD